jgi:protease I
MPAPLTGRKVAVLATDGVEEVELTAPWNALKTAGAEVKLISDKPGEIQAMNHDQKGSRFPVDAVVSQVSARDFDALVLPGGVANPDRLRTNKDAVNFVRAFMEADKPVAAVPDDLPAFCAELVDLLSTAIEERRLDKMVEQSFPASDPLPGPIALG